MTSRADRLDVFSAALRKKKTAYIRVILLQHFDLNGVYPNNVRNSATGFLEEEKTCVIMLGFYRQMF